MRCCREYANKVYFVNTQFELFDAINKNLCVAIKPNSANDSPPNDEIGMILGKISCSKKWIATNLVDAFEP